MKEELSVADLERTLAAIREKASGTSKPSCADCYSNCDICGGDGYVHELMADGSTMRTRPCACRIEKQNLARVKRSGLGRAIKDYRLDNFIVNSPHTNRMMELARQYVTDIDNGGEGWLYIGGAVGCGKTHICTAVCAELMRRGQQVLYIEWLPVARNIKALITESEAGDIIGRYIDADVLYVDDLFKAQHRDGQLPRPTDSDTRVAFEIFNGRYVRRAPTIVTSEWYLEELLDVDEGTFSRLYQMAKDYSLKVTRERSKNWRIGGGV